MQKISIDPTLWATVRRTAFDRQTTASKLVEAALVEYLGGGDERPDDMAIMEADRTLAEFTVPMKREPATPSDEQLAKAWAKEVAPNRRDLDLKTIPPGTKTVFEEAAPALVTMSYEPAVDARLHEVSVTDEKMPWDAGVSPKVTMGAVITTPEEAAAKVAEIRKERPFTPVPKPVSTKKPRARR